MAKFFLKEKSPADLLHAGRLGMAHPLDAARGVSVCLLVGFVDGEGAAMEDRGTVAALAFLVPGHVGEDLMGLEVDDLRDDDTLLLNPVDLIDVLADHTARCRTARGRGQSSASISARRLLDSRC